MKVSALRIIFCSAILSCVFCVPVRGEWDLVEQPKAEQAPAPPAATALDATAPGGTDATGALAIDGNEAYIHQEETAPGWHLPQPNFLKKHGFVLGGWLEQGITFTNHPDAQFNGPVFTNDWNGEYQMNQFWMFLDRPAKNDGDGWAWGAHLDMIYGTDWRFGITNGLTDRINGFNRQPYGLAIPQAYGEVAYNNLLLRGGHFAGILGYEVVAAPPNPFYSHSYAMAFSEPILVTGFLADYKLNDRWSLLGGLTRGWMQFEDNNNIVDFMGGVRWNSENKKTSLAYSVNVGPQDEAGIQQRFVGSLVYKYQLTERLQYILQNDIGQEQNAPAVDQVATWYGINQYALYKLNDRWSLNTRVEWFRDADGVRVAGAPDAAGIRIWDGGGFAGDFNEITIGLNYRPNANWLFRPELRWDGYNGPRNAAGQLPFNNGESSSQFLVAADAILTF